MLDAPWTVLPPGPYAHAFRDGMIEHAWERVFSYMLSAHGPWHAPGAPFVSSLGPTQVPQAPDLSVLVGLSVFYFLFESFRSSGKQVKTGAPKGLALRRKR